MWSNPVTEKTRKVLRAECLRRECQPYIEHSPGAHLLMSVSQTAALLFPILLVGDDRFTRLDPVKSETLKLLLRRAVVPGNALDVSLNGETLGLSSNTKYRFKLGMDGDAHGWVLAVL